MVPVSREQYLGDTTQQTGQLTGRPILRLHKEPDKGSVAVVETDQAETVRASGMNLTAANRAL